MLLQLGEPCPMASALLGELMKAAVFSGMAGRADRIRQNQQRILITIQTHIHHI